MRQTQGSASWPRTVDDLVADQIRLAGVEPEPWRPSPEHQLAVGACWVCFPRGLAGRGATGDRAWVSAVVMRGRRIAARVVLDAAAAASYEPGLLALREGPLLDAAVRRLNVRPDVLLVNATSRDHPRRAGLALHLGAVLDLPTIGITHRPLIADAGEPPTDRFGATSPVRRDGEVVAYWLRTRVGRRAVLVHPGWRVDAQTALEVVRQCTGRHRTPAPLREARRLARQARASRVFGGESPSPNSNKTGKADLETPRR